MENIVLTTIARSTGVYILALFLTRIIGRKLISQMTFFDFVVGVSMGSIAANAMIWPSGSPLSSIVSLIVISALSIGAAYIHIKSFKARKLLNSEPMSLVQNGTINEENMKNTRLTINELMMKLREKNAFNLADVEFAIMETDGQLSVMQKPDKSPVTPSQMNIQTSSEGLMKDVIIDGHIMEENLKGTGLDVNWIKSQLKNQNINNVTEVFYGGLYGNNKLHISKRLQKKKEEHGKYGIE